MFRMLESLSIPNVKLQPQSFYRNETVEVTVLRRFHLEHSQIFRQITESSLVYCSSIIKNLRAVNFHLYTINLIQGKIEDDADKRLQVCKQISQHLI